MSKQSPLKGLYRRYPCAVPKVLDLVYQAVDSKVSSQLRLALANREFSVLVGASLDPSTYDCPRSFAWDYLCVELAGKYPYFDLKIDREAVALSKFVESEALCSLTNQRIRETCYGARSPFHSQLWGARRKIARLLGPFAWSEAELHFGWGPGATTRLPRHRSDASEKYSGLPETTSSNAMLARCAIRSKPLWLESVVMTNQSDDVSATTVTGSPEIVKIVKGNRITTVPKSAKTDRVIAIEPCMNMYIQKGIGSCIRRRLKRVGVNLDDQTSNQRLAREGSIDGSLCTVDLSMASDTISYEIVKYLLPSDWFDAMDQSRSMRGTLPSGEEVHYQKFSSMGNGFTFELESLVFWALVASSLDHNPQEKERRLGVYGDDLIFSSSLYSDVSSLLRFCGFLTNPKKSFSSGPFRESCGKHYFRGFDVTPFYLRDKVDCYARSIWLCNTIRRYSARITVWGCDGTLKPVWDFVASPLDGFWRRPRIPDGFGDGGLIGAFDEVSPPFHRGFQALMYRQFVIHERVVSVDKLSVLVKALDRAEKSASTEVQGSAADVKVGLRKTQYKVVKTTLVGQWPELGPWLLSHS